jgi:NADPH2:quinone reductase
MQGWRPSRPAQRPNGKLVGQNPAGIGDEDAAAVFFKAMTVQYLVKKTYA